MWRPASESYLQTELDLTHRRERHQARNRPRIGRTDIGRRVGERGAVHQVERLDPKLGLDGADFVSFASAASIVN